jgi:hypothetical protein
MNGVEQVEGGGMMFTGAGIDFFRMVSLRGALRMEVAGMSRRGQSAFKVCKQVYGLKGTKVEVLAQMTYQIEQAKAKARE